MAKARRAMGEDRVSLERQEAALESAVVDINLSIGRGAGSPLALSDDPAGPAGAPAELAPAVEAGHVRYRENLVAQEVAGLDLDIAKADRWPKVTGSISYFRQDPEFYKVYSRFDQIYNLTFGLSISFPIFDGFLTAANIEQAEVARQRLTEQRRQVEADLDGRITRAVTEHRRLQSVAVLQADNAKAAEEELELARERYNVGDGTELEVRDAQLAVTRARLSVVQTRFDLRTALARYHYARGDLLNTYLPKEQP